MISCFELSVPRMHADGPLFRDVGFELEEGSWTEFVGPPGSGKSVLFSLLALRRLPLEGRLVVAGRNVDRLEPAGRSELRRSMGTCGEEVRLIDDRTVTENIAAPLAVRGEVERALTAVETTLERLDFARLRDAEVGGLSPRRRRCVGLMRAVAGTPRIILLDSPLRGLEEDWAERFLEEVARCRERGSTVAVFGRRSSPAAPDDRRVFELDSPEIRPVSQAADSG